MTAPTEAEIRALVTTAIQHGPEARDWTVPVRDALDDAFGELASRLDRLYHVEDMRPSEVAELDRIVRQAIDPIRKRTGRDLEAAIIAAGIEFADTCPDAPRKPQLIEA